MQSGPELLAALLEDMKGKTRAIVLTNTGDTAAKMAVFFEAHLKAEGLEAVPAKHNPCFMRVSKVSWILFIPAEELTADDAMGQVDVVYWPTEGQDYACVPFAEWKKLRAENVWRPLAVHAEEPREPGVATAYDHLLD